MDLKKLPKNTLIEMVQSTQRENLKLLARQVKICDLVKAWEETGQSPAQYLRKVGDVVRYDEY